ncbi:Hint domain-containing protein [Paracoccus alkanivorans]|uniref:Hint domain-containing protein n=1 Tax=Paracoccus alkanivorans TaxID=2116655 RepID=UPI0024414B4C|nr:Hint domain-containing protein [Paracoccus alkanivorans]
MSEEVESVDAACFVSGTLIETSSGLRLVEELKAGDAVRTLDNGYRKILWTGSWSVDSIDLLYKPKLYPIRIRAGSLGENMPSRDLVVSRQHRILIGSEISKRMFGSTEVMVPAINLVDCDGISIEADASSVTYWHVLLENHEVLFAEGAMVESMYLGKIAIRNLSSAAREEISLIFPGISDPDFFYPPARKFIEARESARKLIHRYKKDNMPMITDKTVCRDGPTSWPKA